jgi:predicted RNase H-like HicB family nuclease
MAGINTASDRAASYLKRPYARLIFPESDDTYRAEILEFPGCIATGDTPAEALEALGVSAAEWLDAAIERNQVIPDPIENTEFSGRLLLRMPKGLHKKAARIAEHDGVSLNQFIVTSLAEQIGERSRRHNDLALIVGLSANITVVPGTQAMLTRASQTMAIPAQSPIRLGQMQALVISEGPVNARS